MGYYCRYLVDVVEVTALFRPVSVAHGNAVLSQSGQVYDHHTALLPDHLEHRETNTHTSVTGLQFISHPMSIKKGARLPDRVQSRMKKRVLVLPHCCPPSVSCWEATMDNQVPTIDTGHFCKHLVLRWRLSSSFITLQSVAADCQLSSLPRCDQHSVSSVCSQGGA